MSIPQNPEELSLGKRLFATQFNMFLDLLFGPAERVKLDRDNQILGTLLRAFDKKELKVHVEFPPGDLGDELKYPRIWRAYAWKDSYVKYLKDKEKSARNRHYDCLLQENYQRLLKAFHELNGLSDDNNHDRALLIARQGDEVVAAFLKTFIDKTPYTPEK